MSGKVIRAAAVAALGLIVWPSAARATFHEWRISEVYSSGSVQFVEFQQPSVAVDDESFVGGQTLTDSSLGHTFTFPANLPSVPTANSHFLVGTTAYAALSGVPAPDYVIPNNFFNPAGDTLTYASFVDTFTFTGAQLPSDGVHSLARASWNSTTLATPVNSPTNLAGATGSVSAPEPAGAAIVMMPLLLAVTRRRARR